MTRHTEHIEPSRPLTANGLAALEQLRLAGAQGVQLSVLRQAGIHMPAQAVYELELSGWPIQRVAAGVRLRPEGERHPEPPPPRPRVRRVGAPE